MQRLIPIEMPSRAILMRPAAAHGEGHQGFAAGRIVNRQQTGLDSDDHHMTAIRRELDMVDAVHSEAFGALAHRDQSLQLVQARLGGGRHDAGRRHCGRHHPVVENADRTGTDVRRVQLLAVRGHLDHVRCLLTCAHSRIDSAGVQIVAADRLRSLRRESQLAADLRQFVPPR